MIQQERKKIKLYCVPYSGGSATAYLKWGEYLSKDIEIVPIELSGRGKRIYEPLYETMEAAAEDVANTIIKDYQDGDVYAIYGHSLGSLIAYEAYYKLKDKTKELPCHIFFSGRRAPQVIGDNKAYYKLPDLDFIDVVSEYGGNTKQVMSNSELRKVFLPILRSDFKIAETYEWSEKQEKINCDITIINGTQDLSIQPYDMYDWEECCCESTSVLETAGSHFFLFEHVIYVTNVISSILRKYLNI